MTELVRLKAEDYADDRNVFSNFENTALLTGLSVPQVFHVMISIKTERLRQLMAGKTPNFESKEDTLKDLSNYCALWISWERERRVVETGPGRVLLRPPSPGEVAQEAAATYDGDLTALFNSGIMTARG